MWREVSRRIRLLIFPVIAILAISSRAFPQTIKANQVRLLTTGQFHGSEVSAHSGERWLGLYVKDKESTLASSVLNVERVHDEVVDEDTDAETGKEVSVNLSPPEPVFLVRGAAMLNSGPVTTLFNGQDIINEKFDRVFEFSGVKYHLKVTSKKGRSAREFMPPDAQLVLTDGTTSQVLYDLSKRHANDPSWELLWVGDLDGDGKLDFYVDVSYHYNISARRLFLSSQVQGGKLVQEIAVFISTGC